jgi:hypothetical protein
MSNVFLLASLFCWRKTMSAVHKSSVDKLLDFMVPGFIFLDAREDLSA